MGAAGAGRCEIKEGVRVRPPVSVSVSYSMRHSSSSSSSLPPSSPTSSTSQEEWDGVWRRRWRDKLQSRSCREPARDDGKDGWTDGRMGREAGSFHFRLCSVRFNGLKRSGEDRYSVRPLTAMLAASFLRLWATKLSPPQVTQINCRKKLGVRE